jgi:mannose-1-phosphate guanylyltransferase / mannose-6-phosphate isomerase
MNQRIIPAIMSGGAGTRLWPLSTEARPKQFHALGWDVTLFAATARRLRGEPFGEPIVLCNARHVALARAELGDNAATYVLEPEPRNTAAVAAIAAAVALERAADALVLLAPADHVVADAEAFRAAIVRAAPFAGERIVTFGITPDRPATGYGYIKRGAALGGGVFAIERFREKPDAVTAQRLLDEGGYSWNAGIFLFAPRLLLGEFDVSPAIRDGALASLGKAERSGDEIRLDTETFARIASQPLDIAVMEKTGRAAVAPCDIGWADIGTWDEVWRLAPRDARGYALLGAAADTNVEKIRASGVPVGVIEGEDLLAIAAPHGVLVVPRAIAQNSDALAAVAVKL